MDFPYGETVTVVSRVVSDQDEYGNDIFTTTTTDYSNVPVWQTGSSESTQGADMVTSDLTIVLPVGADVSAIDKVQVSGADFEVAGSPWTPNSVWTGTQPGVIVQLKRVTG